MKPHFQRFAIPAQPEANLLPRFSAHLSVEAVQGIIRRRDPVDADDLISAFDAGPIGRAVGNHVKDRDLILEFSGVDRDDPAAIVLEFLFDPAAMRFQIELVVYVIDDHRKAVEDQVAEDAVSLVEVNGICRRHGFLVIGDHIAELEFFDGDLVHPSQKALQIAAQTDADLTADYFFRHVEAFVGIGI